MFNNNENDFEEENQPISIDFPLNCRWYQVQVHEIRKKEASVDSALCLTFIFSPSAVLLFFNSLDFWSVEARAAQSLRK